MLFSRHRTGEKRPERLYAFPHQRVTRIDTRIRVQHLTKKKLFIRTWGCQMNVYDSARMADVLAPLGYAPAETPDGADMVILNTCHIREKATEKLFSELGRLREAKALKRAGGRRDGARRRRLRRPGRGRGDHRPRALAWTSCSARRPTTGCPRWWPAPAAPPAAVLERDFPAEDKFDHLPDAAAPQRRHRLPDGAGRLRQVLHLLRRALYPRRRILPPRRRRPGRGAAPGRPPARGRSRCSARTSTPITARARTAATWGLGRLLRELAEIPGLLRLRYTTSHPRDMDDDLIAAHRDLPQLMPFCPSAGAERVRPGAGGDEPRPHRRRLPPHRRPAAGGPAGPGAVLRLHRRASPARRDADFAADHGAGPPRSASPRPTRFKYTPRPGTPAAGAADAQVPEAVKDARLQALQALLSGPAGRASTAHASARPFPFCSPAPAAMPGQVIGRSPYAAAGAPHRPARLSAGSRA